MSERLRPLTVPNNKARDIELAVFDFDGVFTDNTVYVSAKGDEYVRCFRGDGLGLKRLREAGVRPHVLSTEKNKIVEVRCKKLNIEFEQGLKDKAASLRSLAEKLEIPLKHVAYVGNDINDIGCLEIVGVRIVVADALDEARRVAEYVTSRFGGLGAVREVCDWIVACRNYQKKN